MCKQEFVSQFPVTGTARLTAGIRFDVEERGKSQPFSVGGLYGRRPRRGGLAAALSDVLSVGGVDIMPSALPAVVYPRIRVYHAAMIPGLNVTALTYFAASMFWRASVHRWAIARSKFRGIELGPYEEQLRSYLMDESQFPQDCALMVSVPENVTKIVGLSLTPYGGRKGTHHSYKLIVLGVGFHLLVGKQIPRGLRAMCIVRGVGNPIYRTDMLEQAILQDLGLKRSLRGDFARRSS